jgi:hypothetical protein
MKVRVDYSEMYRGKFRAFANTRRTKDSPSRSSYGKLCKSRPAALRDLRAFLVAAIYAIDAAAKKGM